MTIDDMKRYKRMKGYTNAQIAELSGVPLGTVQKIVIAVKPHVYRRDHRQALPFILPYKIADLQIDIIPTSELYKNHAENVFGFPYGFLYFFNN